MRVPAVILGVTLAVAAAVPGIVAAQGLPRTSWDTPDFSGRWDYSSLTPLERPKGFEDRSHFTPEEARAFVDGFDRYIEDQHQQAAGDTFVGLDPWLEWGASVEPDLRTSRIVDPPDGRLPALTEGAAARARAAEIRYRTYSDPEVLWPSDRCVADIVPLLSGADSNYMRLVQTPTHLLLYKEYDHIVRILPISNAPRLPDDVRFWNGEARAHWEGEVLVVETTNLRAENSLEGSGPNMKLTERFSLSGPDQLRYEFTVDDPESFVASWTVLTYIHRTANRMYEFACHEGNSSMIGTLRGSRLQEALGQSQSP
jgi:hypothetical protein